MPLLGQQYESNISVLHDIFPCIACKEGSNPDAILLQQQQANKTGITCSNSDVMEVAGLGRNSVTCQYHWTP